MVQLSFFSADAHPPRVADLVGLLCGPGQAVRFGQRGTARLGVVLDDQWRAQALAQACTERAVEAEVSSTGTDRPVLRTAFRADLEPLAVRWSRGAVKAVPADFELVGPVLRLWVMAGPSCTRCGRRTRRRRCPGCSPSCRSGPGHRGWSTLAPAPAS